MKKTLAFLNLVCVVAVGFYYFKVCALPAGQVFAVSPQVFILAACFAFLFIGGGFLKSLAVPSLLYYGITGLFLYPWKGFDIANQCLHILMLANVVYFLLSTLLRIQIIRLVLGLAFGLFVVAGIRFYQIKALNINPKVAKSYLPKNLHPKVNLKKIKAAN
ncbi:MAG: hypothetical protein ABIJ15_03665 [bacterium]